MKESLLESINYSNYNPNAVIKINKYISESEGFLRLPLIRAIQGQKTLLISPTGSGKTYSIINMLKEVDNLGEIKSIFIVPNSINVEQIKVEYEVPGAWGDIPVLPELEKGNVIVMTWDKF
ncbi:DEAD/DEAH box helicase family protein, partial [Intestinibacter sp.]|uniref:DEAD/DEAH box helicase family protein n=1 Tax=Intestinibacter sp. TaxID=1965304 RepID=UPI002A908BB1